MRKICFVCKCEKDISEFYKHSKMSDGYLNKCKSCCREQSNKRRAEKLEEIQEYDRNRPNRTERNERMKLYREKLKNENPEKYKIIYTGIRKRYRENHAAEVKAEGMLNEALRTGRITRPSKCSMCGKDCIPQGHHWDYTKPFDVIWVCEKCHSDIHRKVRELLRIA